MGSDSHIDLALTDTMRNYLDDFFKSLQGNTDTFRSFLGKLSTFSSTFRHHRPTLRAETLMAVRNFADMIDDVVVGVMDLEKATNNLHDESVVDISRILTEKMGDLSLNDRESARLKDSTCPAYIKPSYEWLLSNLHNPYPPKTFKNQLSVQTKSPVKDIDAWFIDARKRIGWNRLRKTKFSNKQEKIIVAASHFFKPKLAQYSDDPNSTLISEMNTLDVHRPDFIAIARDARSLYADKFPDLSSSFDSRSLDFLSTPERKQKRVQSPSPSVPITISHPAPLSYPTPEPSPPDYITVSSPSTPFPDPEPPLQSSRKRRHSSMEPSGDDSDNRTDFSKRLRSDIVTKPDLTQNIVDVSQVDISSPSGPQGIPSMALASSSNVSTLKRKRRLSDGDSQAPFKRPHSALCIPRLQTVSNPLPQSALPLEDQKWCQDNSILDDYLSDVIPSPAYTEDAALLATPLTVDLHQYDLSPYNTEMYLPDTCDKTVEAGLSLDGSNSSSALDSLFFINSVEDAGLGFLDPANFSCDLIPPPQSFHCEQLDIPDFVLLNSETLLIGPRTITDPSFSGRSRVYMKAPTFPNDTHAVHRDFSNLDEREAKRIRAQSLRQELAQLIAEGL